MKLAEAQSLFFEVLRGEVQPSDARVSAAFKSDSKLAADARIEIYRGMYESRIVEALQSEFPMLFALLGDCAFADLGRDYLRAHPSEHPDIGQIGRALAPFIRAHAGVRGDLAELAELERARSLAFSAADVEPRAWEELASHGPEAFATTRLELIPALRTMEATHDLPELWRALSEKQQPAPIKLDAPSTLAIWKKEFEVFHAAIDPMESRALARARAGATLGEVCEQFAEAEDPANAAFTAIASWFNEGWVVRIVIANA